jgi:hypothetical protein
MQLELTSMANVEYGVSFRVACKVLSISSCYFYKSTLVNESAEF